MKTVLIAAVLMTTGCSVMPFVPGPKERELEAIRELDRRKADEKTMIYAEDSGRLQGLCSMYDLYQESDLKKLVAMTCKMAGKKVE